jgi:hypothetical protein
VKISVVNRTTLISDEELKPVVKAIQTQIGRDFVPAWGVWAALDLVGKDQPPIPRTWQQYIVDKPDIVNALGYHETTKDGYPIGYTSIQADLDAGLEWSTTLSHEIMEMIVDPFIFSLAQMYDGRYVWLELADAVEAISYPITLWKGPKVMVSDFQLPSWFGTARHPGDSRYSFTGAAPGPFELTKGGYMGVIQKDGSYVQITERRDPMRAEYKETPPEYSRRWRRYRLYEQWTKQMQVRQDALSHRISPHISAKDIKP